MCGIVYARSFIGKPVNKTVKKRYQAQRSRGTEGFGFFLPQENRLVHNTREGRIMSLLRRTKAHEIMFHHRLPTSTPNVRNGCHPYSTKDYFPNNYVLIHNGVIWNDDELKNGHEKFGIKYISEISPGFYNDSEALLWDVAMLLEGWQDGLKAKGSIAFVVTQRDKEGKATATYFGRNYGSPLKMDLSDKGLIVSSEGDGQEVEPNRLYRYSYEDGLLTFQDLKIETGYTVHSGVYRQGNYYDGFGFGYQEYVDDDDFEQKLLSARTGEEVDNIIKRWDNQAVESTRVQRVVDVLMKENYDNPFDAVEDGEEQLEELEKREKTLNHLAQVDLLDEESQDEFFSIPEIKHYLKLAIQELERRTAADKRSSFYHLRDNFIH